MDTMRGRTAIDVDARFTSMFEHHYNEVLAYCTARAYDGGTGAIYVLLRRK